MPWGRVGSIVPSRCDLCCSHSPNSTSGAAMTAPTTPLEYFWGPPPADADAAARAHCEEDPALVLAAAPLASASGGPAGRRVSDGLATG